MPVDKVKEVLGRNSADPAIEIGVKLWRLKAPIVKFHTAA